MFLEKKCVLLYGDKLLHIVYKVRMNEWIILLMQCNSWNFLAIYFVLLTRIIVLHLDKKV